MDNNNGAFISVKEEPPFIMIDGGGEQPPKPVEGLRENGAPPFLKKTFEMVDDSETDAIISWSRTRASFIVWDPFKFSTHLLPKHFKHSNFSSFLRQLNTYVCKCRQHMVKVDNHVPRPKWRSPDHNYILRFRKIDPDRWEFANEGFQQGKKHLLKHIKRRKQNSQITGASQSRLDPTNHRIEAEVKNLRNDHNALTTQVTKLRQQQQDTLHHLTTIQERLHVTETKQKLMAIFMIKYLKNPMVFIEKMKRRKALNNGALKKRRLAYEKSCQLMVESEIQAFSSDESGSSSCQLKETTSFEMSSFDVCSENFVLWEKLMEDDVIYEEEETAIKKQSDIVSELEDLIAKPCNGMVELVGCSASTL